MDAMVIIWICVIVASIVLEAGVPGLVSVWFAIAALAALVLELLGFHIGVQITVFIFLSGLLIVLTRPLAKKWAGKRARTNADRILGEFAVVIEDIDGVAGKGQIKAMGQVWSARSASGEAISAGANVTVLSIEGVKAIVEEVSKWEDTSSQ